MNPGANRYVRSCTVSLWSGNRFLGSGFFLAKQVVVTCAHVVRRASDGISIVWNGQMLRARLIHQDLPFTKIGGDSFPDVAFIAVTDTVDHQIAMLHDDDPPIDDELTVLGYSRFTPEKDVGEDFARVKVEGRAKYVKVRDGVLVPGLSGSPAINDDGLVAGMAKAAMITRDLGSPSPGPGGWLIRGSEIRRLFRLHKIGAFAKLLARATLIRPEPGEPLHRMLSAQGEVANRYPYRIAKLSSRPVPPLSTVYVEQRTQVRAEWSEGGGDLSDWLELIQTRRSIPITPVEMVRSHRHSLLVGGPGGGKSTLFQQLVAQSAEWWLRDEPPSIGAQPALGPVVAIRTAATDLLRGGPWYDSVAYAVNNELRGFQTLGVKAEMFVKAPVPGAEWLILVDGLDEVMDPESRLDLIRMLRDRVAEYGTHVRFVVASRWLDENEFVQLRKGLSGMDDYLRRYGEYQLRPFDDEMLETFANRWFQPPDGKHAKVSPKGFLAMVSESRLLPLVRIPLLATIAAVVYEENDGESLASDRNGLYEQFVSWLLNRRKLRPSARESLVSRLSGLESKPVEFAEFLFDRRRECLTYIADRRLRLDSRKAEVLAEEWIQQQGRSYPDGVDRDLLTDYLVSTGLLEYQGDDLGFIHLSVAEYLAAGLRVAEFEPQQWVEKVKASGPDSLGLFTASQWVRLGNDLVSALAELLPEDGSVTRSDLASAASILEDGAIGDQAEGLIQIADRVIRATDKSTTGVQLTQMLRSMLQRARSSRILTELVQDQGVAVAKRVEAARVLAGSEDQATRDEGIQLLAHIAYEARNSYDDRMLATSALAEVGGTSERIFALQHLMSVIETHPDSLIRSRAMQTLVLQGDAASAIMAVLRRSAAPGRTLSERAETLAWLIVLLPDNPADLTQWKFPDAVSAGWEAMSQIWTARLPQGTLIDANRPVFEDDILLFTATALALTQVFDPRGTQAVLDTLMHDRSWTWGQRVAFARATDRPDLSRRALLALAFDRQEEPMHRVASLLLAAGQPGQGDVRRTLSDWLWDENESAELRALALAELAKAPGEDAGLLDALIDDQSVPFGLRVEAVLLRYRKDQDRRSAAAKLSELARERHLGFGDRVRARLTRLAVLADSLVPLESSGYRPSRPANSRTAPFTD